MKKLVLLFAVGTLALAGCQKNPSVVDVPSGKAAQLTVTLTKSAPSTKATDPGTPNEGKINKVDIFVFNSTGDLDAYDQFDSYDSENKPTVDCTTGPGKIVYCVINGEWSKSTLASSIGNVDALKALVFSLNKNCSFSGETPSTLDNFEMVGSNTKDFVPGGNTISVIVSRAVARVRLQKITRNFSSSALDGTLQVKDVYISNAVGSYGLDGTVKSGADNTWYNKYAYDATTPHVPYPGYVNFDAGMNLWLHDTPASPVSIAQGASAEAEIASVFYVMPNQVAYNAADGGTGSWAPRRTKLVIEVEYTPVGGTAKTYYYSIPICEQETYPELDSAKADTYKGLNANVSYDITELVLTRLGSTNPDEPVVAANVEVKIAVLPWDIYPLETESGKYVI